MPVATPGRTPDMATLCRAENGNAAVLLTPTWHTAVVHPRRRKPAGAAAADDCALLAGGCCGGGAMWNATDTVSAHWPLGAAVTAVTVPNAPGGTITLGRGAPAFPVECCNWPCSGAQANTTSPGATSPPSRREPSPAHRRKGTGIASQAADAAALAPGEFAGGWVLPPLSLCRDPLSAQARSTHGWGSGTAPRRCGCTTSAERRGPQVRVTAGCCVAAAGSRARSVSMCVRASS